jgi:hypothetical protein
MSQCIQYILSAFGLFPLPGGMTHIGRASCDLLTLQPAVLALCPEAPLITFEKPLCVPLLPDVRRVLSLAQSHLCAVLEHVQPRRRQSRRLVAVLNLCRVHSGPKYFSCAAGFILTNPISAVSLLINKRKMGQTLKGGKPMSFATATVSL